VDPQTSIQSDLRADDLTTKQPPADLSIQGRMHDWL
jgi:hypothetical protein